MKKRGINLFGRLNPVLILILIIALLGCSKQDNPANPNTTDNGVITVTPNAIGYGLVLLNQTKKMDLVIQNGKKTSVNATFSITGTDAASFTVLSAPPLAVDGGKSVTVSLEFSPKAEKSFSANLTVTLDKDYTVSLTSTGPLNLAIQPTPQSLDFGKTGLYQSATMTVSVKNITQPATKYSLLPAIGGIDSFSFFIQYQPSKPIDAGATDSVIVKFYPNSIRQFSAVLYLDSNKQYSVPVKGEGIKIIDIAPQALDFSKVVPGQTKSMKVAIQNVTSVTSSFTVVPAIGGTDSNSFSIQYQPSKPVKNGENDSVVIKFSPNSLKSYNAILYLDQIRKYPVQLTGEGAALTDLDVSPNSLNFANVNIGETKDLDVTITNKTGSNLTITTQITGGYIVQSQPTGNILPGVPSKITIRFAPSESKLISGILTINTSNSASYQVPLSGTGVTPNTLTLTAANVGAGPVIDGTDNDAVWNSATELNLLLKQVESTFPDQTTTYNAKLKAVNDGAYIYFLVKIQDATRDDSPNQFVFKGGDASQDVNWTLKTNGQDGISFMFPITSNVRGDKTTETFDKIGCWVACHTPQSFANYEGGSYPSKGAIDIWYWKAGTTNGQGFADDYVSYGDDGKHPLQKLGDEPGTTFSDQNFRLQGTGQMLPVSVAGGDNKGLDKSRFIWDGTSVPFDVATNNPATGNPWASGDVVPGWKLEVQTNPFTERADIEAKGVYQDGWWTVEFKRKLDSQNSNGGDVVLKPGTDIPFSLGYFDSARMWADFEYTNLKSNPHPGHCGSTPPVITLKIK